jgi:DMSO/TMAO reductase YedYZ molybdopterin-dependent catalytic subunit
MSDRINESLPSATLIEGSDITPAELQLAVRNHSMPLEALRESITPLGLHYLLIHFDIPSVDPCTWALTIGGRVRRPLQLTLDEVLAKPRTTLAVTLECAGNGRARLSPRPLSQPWLVEGVSTAEWTGTRLGPILEEAGLFDRTGDVVFTGIDRGVQGGIEQQYERSLHIAEAMRDEVIVAYQINGQPLPPQHGFPLRLIVPGWYGMAHVKWLRSITVIDGRFQGYQQAVAYHSRHSEEDVSTPVTRMLPRALMIPPGIPDFMSRTRFLAPSPLLLEGRAWSGYASVTNVEVSIDGGNRWASARLGEGISAYAWRPWSYEWDASIGEYELAVRASDAAGNVQPTSQNWNYEGVQNNAVQRVRVVVAQSNDRIQAAADEA